MQNKKLSSPLIMVVDDSRTIRAIAKSMLEHHQYQIVTAEDGIDALEKLDKQNPSPDLILLDIDMPRMDGFEFATVVSNNEKLKQIPIIVITSRIAEQNKEKALSLGAKKFIEKPFEEQTLIEAIREVLTP